MRCIYSEEKNTKGKSERKTNGIRQKGDFGKQKRANE